MKVRIEAGVFRCERSHWHGFAQVYFDGQKSERCHQSPPFPDELVAREATKVVSECVRVRLQAIFGDDVTIEWVGNGVMN